MMRDLDIAFTAWLLFNLTAVTLIAVIFNHLDKDDSDDE